MIELRHLRYFVAVAEEGHVTRAAERLGMQQPPLSQQIRALERLVGEQLFRRTARGVELTDAGEVLLTDARAMLGQLDRAVETARRAARGEHGKLTVGFTSTAPFNSLVPLSIRRFHEECPQVSLTVEECLSDELVDRLTSDRIDVAFIRTSPVGSEGLTVTELAKEPMVVALPEGHSACRTKADQGLRFADLAGDVFILAGPPGTGLHDGIIAACQTAGFNPRVGNLGASSKQAPRITSTLSLVAAGLGVTCVPASLQRLAMEGVVYRRLADADAPTLPLSIATRRGDISATVRRFTNLSRKLAGAAP